MSMKYIITLFALFIFYSATSSEEIKIKNDSIDHKITNLDKKVNLIEENLSHSLIQEYKDLNNLYTIGFGLLIALFGVVIPTLLYFGQFKPSQDALKEAKLLLAKIEENFEKSFEEHLRKSKAKIIDKAIESYEKLEEQFLPTSHINLDTYKGEVFSEIQILRLLSLLRRTDIDNENKIFFATVLTFQTGKEIEKYFVDLISSDPKDPKCIWGAIYFAKNGLAEYYNLIADVVLNGYSLIGMLSSLFYESKSFALELLQNEKLVENLEHSKINIFCENLEVLQKRISIEKIKETLLWKKYVTKHDGLH